MSESLFISGGSLLVAVISLLIAFKRNMKGDRRLSDEEIRAEAAKEAAKDAKLDAIGSTLQELKYSIKPLMERVSAHDTDIACMKRDMENICNRFNQHLQTHPPN